MFLVHLYLHILIIYNIILSLYYGIEVITT